MKPWSTGRRLVGFVAACSLLFVLVGQMDSKQVELPALGASPGGTLSLSPGDLLSPSLETPVFAAAGENEANSMPGLRTSMVLGSLQGRLVFGGEALRRSMHVNLWPGKGPYLDVDPETQQRESPFEQGSELEVQAGSLISVETQRDGRFRFGDLDAGSYTLCIRDPGWSLDGEILSLGYGGTDSYSQGCCIQLEYDLAAGQSLDVGDVDLTGFMEDLFAVRRAERRKEEARLLIRSGQAGLFVRVYQRGQSQPSKGGKTDAQGEATLRRKNTDRIRIDLVDRNGYVLASTDNFLSYPVGVETTIELPAIPGTLAIHLPPGTEVMPGEKVQFFLTRTASPELALIVKSIAGDRPLGNMRGIKTAADSIEFKSLREGSYSIRAVRRLVQKGRAKSIETGGWLYGMAHVYPGKVSKCTLE